MDNKERGAFIYSVRHLFSKRATLAIRAYCYMDTELNVALRANTGRERQIIERIPAGHWGTPDDMAGAVVLLASPASDYLHGHLLVIDGGWLAG